MSKLNWPPENTFKYEFNNSLDLEIPLVDNKVLKKAKMKDESGKDSK